MRRDARPVAGSNRGGEQGRKDRVEAVLELGRQRRDVLRDEIDADDLRAGEAPEDEEVEPPRPPVGEIGPGQRRIVAGQPPQPRRRRSPAGGQAEAARARQQRRDDRGDHRRGIGDEQPLAAPGQIEGRHREQRQRPRLDDRPGADLRGDVVAEGERGEADVRRRHRQRDEREEMVEPRDRARREDQRRPQQQQRRAGRREDQPEQHRVGDGVGVRRPSRGRARRRVRA